MKRSKLVFLLLTALPNLLLSAEPSAFGAGDLTSQQPYGLTSNEKVILQTKKNLHKVSVKSNNQANELDSLRERIDGLQSIIESLSRKAHNNKINLQKQNEQTSLSNDSNDEYEKRLSTIVESNSLNIKKLQLLATELTKQVDVINAQYVSKVEFNKLVDDVNNFKVLMVKELKGNTKKSQKNKFDSLSSKEIYNQAKVYFDKKYYTNAIENYTHLIKKKYKPAYSHYMIGEMNFRRKNYSNALSYFKKSSSLYKKASYMPTLMLHSAISMNKTGDEEHAKVFFNAVVSKYPNSNEAIKANEYLQQ